MGTISSEEVNYLVYRYLQESGFVHSAFTFAYESLISKSIVATQLGADVPPGTLIAFIQKGLQLVSIENHLNEDGSERVGDEEFSLLTPYICRAVGSKTLESKIDAVSKAEFTRTVKSDQQDVNVEKARAANARVEVSKSDICVLKSHTSEVFCCAWNPSHPDLLATGSGDATARIWTVSSANSKDQQPPSITMVHTAPIVVEDGSSTTVEPIKEDQQESDEDKKNNKNDKDDSENKSSKLDDSMEIDEKETKEEEEEAKQRNKRPRTDGEENGEEQREDSGVGGSLHDIKKSNAAAESKDEGSTEWKTKVNTALAAVSDHSAASVIAGVTPEPVVSKPGNNSGSSKNGKSNSEGKERDVTTLEWSKNGEILATGGMDGIARLFSKEGELLRTLEGHSQSIFSMRFNTDSSYLLTGSYDYSTIVWDVTTGLPKQRYEVHQGQVLDVDWRDQNTFTSCSSDTTIHSCTLGTPQPIRSFVGHKDEVNAVKWDPSGTILASCSDDSTVKLWNDESVKPLFDLREHNKEIYTIRWSPTGLGSNNPNKPLLLASASFDSTVKLWDVNTGKCKHSLNKHDKKVYTVSFSPSGDYLASGSLGGQLFIWDVKQGKIVKSFRGGCDIFEVAWNQTGDKLACCGATASNAVTIMDFRM